MLSMFYMILPGLSYFGSALLCYVLYRMGKRVYRIFMSPLRSIPGPTPTSLLYGCFDLITESDAYRLFERWTEQFGSTFTYSSSLNVRQIV